MHYMWKHLEKLWLKIKWSIQHVFQGKTNEYSTGDEIVLRFWKKTVLKENRNLTKRQMFWREWIRTSKTGNEELYTTNLNLDQIKQLIPHYCYDNKVNIVCFVQNASLQQEL